MFVQMKEAVINLCLDITKSKKSSQLKFKFLKSKVTLELMLWQRKEFKGLAFRDPEFFHHFPDTDSSGIFFLQGVTCFCLKTDTFSPRSSRRLRIKPASKQKKPRNVWPCRFVCLVRGQVTTTKTASSSQYLIFLWVMARTTLAKKFPGQTINRAIPEISRMSGTSENGSSARQ